MAGTVGTVTILEETYGTIKKIKFSWTSGEGNSEGGKASGTTTKPYSGKILGLATDPGSPAPSVDYDITVTDEDGMDVLMGGGANRHTSNTEYVLSASLGAVANDKLTLNISGAGDSAKGIAYLYIR